MIIKFVIDGMYRHAAVQRDTKETLRDADNPRFCQNLIVRLCMYVHVRK